MAVLLSVCLFAVWTVIGLAILNAGRFRGAVRKLLLAPTLGFAVLALGAYGGIRLGVPVRGSAWPVLAALLVPSLVVLWRSRVEREQAKRTARNFRAFAAVLVGAFVLTAWPMAKFGFDWTANGNDDMANYCIGATGFQANGFMDVPSPDAIRNGEDLCQPMWFMYHDTKTLTEKRFGSELTLALASTWTGLTPQQTFMPVIAAFNVALVGALAGLVLLTTRRRAVAITAAALLAVSSQTTYGLVQQLIAQASGLALCCTSLAMVTSPFRRFPRGLILRRAAVCGMVFAGQIVFYPEVVPFLVGGCVVMGVRDLFRRRPVRRHLWHATAAVVAMAILVPFYVYGTVYFMLGQANQGTGSKIHTIEIFPYFMTPRGPALVLGLLPTYESVPEPRQTISLVFGLALFLAAPLLALQQMRRGRPFAGVLLVMFAMGAALYVQSAAFGLFKLAMFAQPFLWATVAAWVVGRKRTVWIAAGATALVAIALLNARTQYWYVKQSTGHDGRLDLPAVTQQHLMTEFHASVSPRLTDGSVSRVVVACENNVFSKLIAAEIRSVPNSQLAFAPFLRIIPEEDRAWHAQMLRDGVLTSTPVKCAAEAQLIDPDTYPAPRVIDPDTGRVLHQLLSTPPDWTRDDPNRVLLVAGCGQLSPLNRYRHPERGKALLSAPLSSVHNFAVFRDATGARQLFVGMDVVENISMHRLEPDPYFRKCSMAGVGKAMVVDVLNPAPKVRVLLNYTCSFRADMSKHAVCPVQIIGAKRVPLGAIGVSSARLVSPPIEPQHRGPSNLLAVDFNCPLMRNPNHVSGFERAWGTELPRDRRMLSAHLRDLSVISEEEYAQFKPPEKIEKLPDDLAHPHIEYSGFYEEGWASTEFKVRLTQPTANNEMVFRGQIPNFPGNEAFKTELTVLIDGKASHKQTLTPGDFEVRVKSASPGPHWIEFRFSDSYVLPGADGRTATAQIKSIGFEPLDESRYRAPEKLAAFPIDLKNKNLNYTGIDLDGWVSNSAKAQLWFAGADRDLVVRTHIPAADANFKTEMIVLLDGTEVARRTLTPGDIETRVPVGNGAPGPRWVECRFSNAQKLPAPDARTTAALLRSIGFEAK